MRYVLIIVLFQICTTSFAQFTFNSFFFVKETVDSIYYEKSDSILFNPFNQKYEKQFNYFAYEYIISFDSYKGFKIGIGPSFDVVSGSILPNSNTTFNNWIPESFKNINWLDLHWH